MSDRRISNNEIEKSIRDEQIMIKMASYEIPRVSVWKNQDTTVYISLTRLELSFLSEQAFDTFV